MKANQGSRSSCSCTSCMYKSESEHPSVQRIITEGSRIDKLYLGKYIPLREKKLLAKLLMTRAVYNDARTELQSSSDVSLEQKIDSKPRKHVAINKREIEIDQRDALGSNKLSECCSCCSSICGLEYATKVTRPQRHSHHSGANYQQQRTRQGRNKVTSKSSIMTRSIRHNKRFKAKDVHSTPCVCPWNKNRQRGLEHTAVMEDEQSRKMRRRHKVPVRKIRHSKSHIRRSFEEGARSSLKVLKESKSRVKRHLQGTGRKSIEKMKNTKNKMKNKMAGIKNLHKSPPHGEGFNNENDEDWACDLGCEPEECEPEECLKKLLEKKSQRSKRTARHRIIRAEKHGRKEPKININIGRGQKEAISKQTKKSKEVAEMITSASNTESSLKNAGIATKDKQEIPRKKVKSTDTICACETKSIQSMTKVSSKDINKNMSQQAKINHSNRKSEAKIKQFMKDTQADHVLKRCFCTLKLKTMNLAQKKSKSATISKHRKGLKTHSTENMQTEPCINKCHPFQCMPSECKNTDCAKRIKSFRAKKMITAHQTKSISSTTKSSSSTSKPIQARSQNKIKTKNTSVKPFIKIPKQQKRIPETRNAATSSFDVLLDKDIEKSNAEQYKKNRAIGVEKLPRQHKRSQRIISAGKSKYTLTKNNLRRCFCTLKLNKSPKETAELKSSSKSSMIRLNVTKVDKQQPQLIKSATDHKKKFTKNHNKKFSSSSTSRSDTRNKAKRVQSTEISHKSEVPIYKRKNKEAVVIKKIPREARPVTSSNKQAVKIRSSVSFNVQFSKDPSEPNSDIPMKYVTQPQAVSKKSFERNMKRKVIKERGSQGDYTRHKSIPMQVKSNKTDAGIGAAIKRCFCTLKLQKSTKNITTNILDESSFTRFANKGIQPKQYRNKYDGKLEPYECEPHICIPDKCDINECFERIKKRNSKEFGTSFENSNMRSSSSNTQSSAVSSGTRTYKTRMKKQETTMKPRKPVKKHMSEKFKNKQSRQVVKIGSSFSFDIEFYKNRVPVVQKRQPVDIPADKIIKPQKYHTNTGTTAFHTSNSSHESQVESKAKMHKGVAVKPMLKRCFCTLQLLKQDKQDLKNERDKKNKENPPNVYTVSRVTIGPTKFMDKNNSANSYNNKAYELNYFRKKNNTNTVNRYQHNIIQKCSSSFGSSNAIEEAFPLYNNIWHRSKDSSVSLVPVKSSITNKKIRINSIINLQSDNDHNSLLKHYIQKGYENLYSSKCQNLKQHHKELKNCVYSECNQELETNSNYSGYRCFNPITKHNFYAMNIEAMQKLQPYECESGVCKPYPGECDPNEYSKLINKRLVRSKKNSSGSSRSSLDSKARTLLSYLQRRIQKTKVCRSQTRQVVYNIACSAPRRQMVRVESNFSFDVEFSKNNSPMTKKNQHQMKQKDIKPNITKHKTKITNAKKTAFYHHNRDSQSGVTMIGKGRTELPKLKRCFCTLKLNAKDNEEMSFLNNRNLGIMTPLSKRKEVNMTEIGQNSKAYKTNRELGAYECGPNVYIPSKYYPYECLELIKRRTNVYHCEGKHSRSSRSTLSGIGAGESYEGRCGEIKLRERKHLRSVSIFKGITTKTPTPLPQKSQVERIGSSLSFNIEFYKDDSAAPPPTKTLSTRTTEQEKNHSTSTRPTSGGRLLHSHDSQTGEAKMQDSSIATLKRCFCTMKFHKQLPGSEKHIESKNQVKAQVIKKSSAIYERGAICSDKYNKLLPYEYERVASVQEEFDPYECDDRIKKRHKQSGTSIAHRTKSVSSVSASTASVYRKMPQSYKIYEKKFKPVKAKKIYIRSGGGEALLSPRQDVRIGSSFSFDIDFRKDQRGDGLPVQRDECVSRSKPKTRKSLKPKPKQIKKAAETQGAQYLKNTRSIESQISIITKNMVSTVSGLKRSFCTLRLQAPDNKLPTSKKSEGKNDLQVILEPKQNQKGRRAHKLEPYECEPGVCIPGQCDPYECLRRMKRKMRSQTAGTDKDRGRSVSTVASKTAHAKAGQTRSQSPRHRDKRVDNKEGYVVEQPRFSASGSPHRQAVRISSSFSFNVEFYKDRTAGLPEVPVTKYETKKNVCNKDGVCDKNVCARGECQDKAICSQGICLRNRGLQAHGPKTEHRQVGPMLKRCFCTLKLQKNLTQEPTGVPTTDIGVGTKKKYHNLEPYECEPGVCVPGQCDPYECLKRIQKRNMTDFSTETAPTHINTSTLTSKDLNNRDKNTQSHRVKEKRDKMAAAIQPKQIKQPPRPSYTSDNRQSVRIGSKFSFDIEFFKDRAASGGDSSPRARPKTYKTKNWNDAQVHTNPKTTADKGHGYNKRLQDQSQMAGVNTESKGSGMGPMLKRCFCTLKLKKATHAETKIVNFVSLDVKAPPMNEKYNPETLNSQKPFIQQKLFRRTENLQTRHNSFAHDCGTVRSNRKCNIHNVKVNNNTKCSRPFQVRARNNKLPLQDNIFKRFLCSLKINKNSRSDYKIRPQSISEVNRKPIKVKDKKPASFDKEHKKSKIKKFNIAQKPVMNHKRSYSGKRISIIENRKDKINHEMTTIFPYVPNKFKNNVSNTFLIQNKINLETKQNPGFVRIGDNINTPSLKKDVKNKTKQNTKALNQKNQLPGKPITEKSSKIKEMFHRFTNILSKSLKFKKDNTENHITVQPKPFNQKRTQKHEGVIKTDVLKTSKSDRHPLTRKNIPMAKKSKSVKVTRVSAKEKHLKTSPVSTIQHNKKYSYLQSGDTDKINTAMRNIKKRSSIPYKYDIFQCSYCETRCDLEKKTIPKVKNYQHTFNDSKIIQLALLSHKSDYCPCGEDEKTGAKVMTNDKSAKNKTQVATNDKSKFDKSKAKNKTQATATSTDAKENKGKNVAKSKEAQQKVKCKTRKPCVCCKGTAAPPPPVDEKQKGKKQTKKAKKKTPSKKLEKCIDECKTESVDTKSIPEHVKDYLLKYYKKCLQKEKVEPCNYTPLFELKIGSKNMALLNSEILFDEMRRIRLDKTKYMKYMSPKMLEESHGKNCKCCICVSARKAQPQFSCADVINQIRNRIHGVKPCICGSITCAEKLQELQLEERRRKESEKKKKPCVCGTKICEEEKLKIDLENRLIDKKKAKSMKKDIKDKRSVKKKARMKKTKEKTKHKELLERQKQYKIQDAIRKKQRLKADKLADKQVKQFRNADDKTLVLEALLDIVKCGFKTISGLFRFFGRAIFDPKNTCAKAKTMKDDPKRLLSSARDAWQGSGAGSTASRVGKRLASTTFVTNIKTTMEEHPLGAYAVNACEKDPAKRLKKKRRKREPMDFQCSLFMASLRKRPWLCIYYKCPWFYPHCISMLNLWRQFTDVMLFLLAVFAWSPCILAMEICRACMCCTMCTA